MSASATLGSVQVPVTPAIPIAPIARPAVDADGLIYLSAITATPDAPGFVAPGSPDLARQTKDVLDRMSIVLRDAGSSLGDLVNVNVFLRYASDFDAMNGAYKAYVTDKPPARTTVAADLPPGVLVEMSAVAVPAGAPRTILHPSTWAKSPRPYAYAVRAGDLVFLAGLVSRRGTDDAVVTGSVATQVRTILENAGTLLRTAGLTYENVVSARVFITDDGQFDEMNDAYRRYFHNDPPARATAVVGLMGTDAKVEISLVASTQPKEVIGPQVSPTIPVSTAIRAGRRVFLCGLLGTSDTNLTDATSQTQEAMNHVSHTLDLAGVTFDDIVDATIYAPDLSVLPKIDDVYGGYFPKGRPARTVTGARLVTRAGLVEIVATAVR